MTTGRIRNLRLPRLLFCLLQGHALMAQTVVPAAVDAGLYRSNEALVASLKLSGLIEEDEKTPGKLKPGPAASTPLQHQYVASVCQTTWKMRQEKGGTPGGFLSEREAAYKWEQAQKGITTFILCKADAEIQSRVVVEMARSFFEHTSGTPAKCVWHHGTALVSVGLRGIKIVRTADQTASCHLQFELLPNGRGSAQNHGRLLAREPVAVFVNPLCPDLKKLDPLPLKSLTGMLLGRVLFRDQSPKICVGLSALACLHDKLGVTSTVPMEAGEIDRLVFGNPLAVGIVPWGRAMNSDNHLLRLADSTESWPTPLTVASGAYPFILELWCQTKPAPDDFTKAFSDFLGAEESRMRWIKLGYLKAPPKP